LAFLLPAVTSPPVALKTLTAWLIQAKAAVEGLRYSALEEWQVRLAVGSADFRLFGPLQKHLAGKRFATDVDMKQAATSYLHTLDKVFFYAGI
jgi:hypothetical protein